MIELEILDNLNNDIQLLLSWNPGEVGMDTTPGPDKAHYTLWVDGQPRAIDALNSSAGSRMRCYALGAQGYIDFRLQLTTVDPDTQNLNGVKATAPQELTVAV